VAPTDLKTALYLAVDGGRAMELMLSACEEKPDLPNNLSQPAPGWNELSVRLKETPAVVGLSIPAPAKPSPRHQSEALAGTVFAALYMRS
jgi:hypothetical protein